MKLQDVIAVGLNGIEAGVDTKQEVKERILDHVRENYVNATTIKSPNDLPLGVVEMLHYSLGMTFDVHDGRITKGGLDCGK